MSLDPTHSRYDPRAREMLTSPAARAAGIRYLDCVPHGSVYTVARYRVRAVRSDAGGATAHEADGATGDGLGGSLRSLRIYANPRQPEFLGKPYAFIYPPAPSAGADAAWELAPGWRDHDGVQIWLCHSPPMGRLDRVPVPGLTGCAVMAAKVAEARPLLCVFGHYHYSWGVERVVWGGEGGTEAVVGPPMAANVTCLAMSKERQEAEKIEAPMKTAFDFTGNGEEKRLEVGKETVFVNAGWMTMKKSQWEYRNPPFVVTLALP